VDAADAGELRASGVYRVVTPDECVALAKELGPTGSLVFHPLMGGMDIDLGWESLQLFADKVYLAFDSLRPIRGPPLMLSCGAGSRHDEGDADFAQPLVRGADHRGLPNLGMLEEGILDLGRIGVEAAHDEHVPLAVGDAEVAALVHDADVAGVQPALAIDGAG